MNGVCMCVCADVCQSPIKKRIMVLYSHVASSIIWTPSNNDHHAIKIERRMRETFIYMCEYVCVLCVCVLIYRSVSGLIVKRESILMILYTM